jgi:catechol 2,3-dioxygenase-like lactoylglutathione lyase family enzyme
VAGLGGASLWFIGRIKPVENDYDGPGMNHFAFSAPTAADVDAVVEYVKGQGVPALFETPRHRPEFAQGDANTY